MSRLFFCTLRDTFHTHIRACVLEALDEKVIFKDFTRSAIITGKNPTKRADEKYLNYNDFKSLIKACEERLDERYSSPYLINLLVVLQALDTPNYWD